MYSDPKKMRGCMAARVLNDEIRIVIPTNPRKRGGSRNPRKALDWSAASASGISRPLVDPPE